MKLKKLPLLLLTLLGLGLAALLPAGTALANDVGVNPELLVDGWYGDDAGNGLLLQEAQVIRDGEVVSIVVALFFEVVEAGVYTVWISQPFDHFAAFDPITTRIRPAGVEVRRFMILDLDVQLQPSPTLFTSVVRSAELFIEGAGSWSLDRLP